MLALVPAAVFGTYRDRIVHEPGKMNWQQPCPHVHRKVHQRNSARLRQATEAIVQRNLETRADDPSGRVPSPFVRIAQNPEEARNLKSQRPECQTTELGLVDASPPCAVAFWVHVVDVPISDVV